MTISGFSYENVEPEPYLTYDVDLRPYRGYDIEWIQLGDQKPLVSPYLSIYYSFGITKRFHIKPELSFTQKGVNFNQFDYERIIYVVKINNLEFPLSLVYNFRPEKKLSFDLYGGRFAAFKIKLE